MCEIEREKIVQTLDAIFTRRSIRSFTADAVSDEDLQAVVQAGAAAPSAGNDQAWVFIAVRQPQRLAALRALAPGLPGRPPAVIVLCLDSRRRSDKKESQQAHASFYDIGAALENMLLAAHELGLGGCAVGSFHLQGISTLLGLPQAVAPHLLLALGRPKITPRTPPRRPLGQIFFEEKYPPDDANG